MLSFIFSTYLILTILMCFIRLKVGIALYLFYFILIPYINIGNVNLNTIFPLILLLAYFYKYGIRKIYLKPLYPFLFLYIALFLLIPFHQKAPLAVQIYFFTSDITKLALPFVMINIMYRDQKAISLFYMTLLTTIVINVLYSLVLILIPGLNPYLMIVLPLSGQEFLDWYASPETSNRIFGRISGVFTHPMANGLFLSFTLFFILFLIKNTNKDNIKYYILIVLSTLSILTIGVRTAILTVTLSTIIYLIIERKINVFFYTSISCLFIYIIINQIPGMTDYFKSIFDSSSSNVGGSSFDMRLNQLNGALFEIRNNPIFGNGYGWNIYYQVTKGDHPILFAFESLIFMILCDNGIIGIIIWCIMITIFLIQTIKNSKYKNSSILISLFSVYIIYSIITGEYGYMKYFLIFYSIIYMKSINDYSYSYQFFKTKYLSSKKNEQ